MLKWVGIVVAALLALAIGLNWQFVKRYTTFVWLGGDPLTLPADWHQPLAPLETGDVHALPRVSRATIEANALGQASDYARDQGSLALLVARAGKIEYEKYWQGFTKDDWFNPHEMSNTLLALAIGIAEGEGHLSVDDPVERYLTEWRGDPRGQITIEQLLQMSGGLEQVPFGQRPAPWSASARQQFGDDIAGFTLDLSLSSPPGARFAANNSEAQLLSLVLERATGLKYADFLSLRLWQPMGLGPAALSLDRPRGRARMGCCLLSRPVDWLALGQLMLNRGNWRGRQLVPARWIDRMLAPSPTEPGFGYQVWLGNGSLWHVGNHPGPEVNTWWGSEPYSEDDIFALSGYGYQNVWVVPALDLVILRAARRWPDHAWDVSRIPNLLIRALRRPATTG